MEFYHKREWCPKCQEITNHQEQDSLLVHLEYCLKCGLLLRRYPKIKKHQEVK